MSEQACEQPMEIARLRRRLERERATRLEAEAIAEKGLRDLYDRQKQLELLEHITAAANQMHSVQAVLQFAVDRFCQFAGWSLGHAFMAENGVLRSADAWHIAEPGRTTIFRTVTANTEFTAGAGLPGQALATGKPAWMGDLGDRGSFPRFQFARRCGLKCGVSFPVLSGDEVVAVVEFYGTETRAPDPVLVELMVQAGTQLGRAIERQRAQDRLQAQTVELATARDEAKDADRAKSAFLANMSHELRTPLNAIIGFSEMMLGGVYGPLNDKYAEYAGDIRSSGVHLKNILNDILDLSKIDAGAMQIYPRPVSLAETAEACRRLVMPMAEAGGVALSIAIQERMPLFELDPTRFQQALLNILSNAVKFTPRDGHVEVHARLERLECVISVTDTGIGMTAEGVQLALKPFRQVDSNLNRRFEGTGLGLPLAKALTELHGGRITIESEPEKGTTVELHLPAELAVRAA